MRLPFVFLIPAKQSIQKNGTVAGKQMLKKNDILQVEVTDLNHEGLGIAKAEGVVIFVQAGVTGDKALVKIIKSAKNYCVARIEELIEGSKYRAEPVCPYFKRCGGCVYQHITPEYENKLKKIRVEKEFKRFGITGINVEEIVSGEMRGYRNKLQCPVSGDGEVGFYARMTHEIVPIEKCILQHRLLEPVSSLVFAFIKKNPVRGLRHLYFRCAVGTGEVMVCFVSRSENPSDFSGITAMIKDKLPQVTSVMLNVNGSDGNVILGDKTVVLHGRGYIEDILCGNRFRISPLSFYQVNHEVTEKLYACAAEFACLKPTDKLLDMYCGTGTIGLCINSMTPVAELTGTEIVSQAVDDAKTNAQINGVSNAEFICCDAADSVPQGYDVIICDPPRKGLSEKTVTAISAARPERIVYISCSPDTLARDCVRFISFGYNIKRVKAFNMFPRTGHVESFVCLTRK